MKGMLIIGEEEREAMRKLRELAAEHPIEMQSLVKKLKDPAHKRRHMEQMTRQSIQLPVDFMLTYSIEHGHPAGTCRHMSLSVSRDGRVPNEHAVWMVADELGFVGGLEACMCWQEDLLGHGKAINVVQPVSYTGGGTS
jgi:hypothetical protein